MGLSWFKFADPLMSRLKHLFRAAISVLSALAIIALLGSCSGPGSVGLNRYLFVPDYVGKSVFIQALTGGRQRYTFTIPDCNPNSIARSDADLIYVACNKDFGNGDHIEVYDLVELSGLRPRGYLEVPSKKTITSPEFNSIIDLKFDPDGNMWVSSYGNNQIIRFPKSSLDLSNPQPKPDVKLVNSPDSPVGITFDSLGSLWVVGQFEGGIVLRIPKSELNKTGTIVSGINSIDATPNYCISNMANGCLQKSGLFDAPEGIAILGNEVFVSNNGGNHPGASLVRLPTNQNNALAQSVRLGNNIAAPFTCPGGLQADVEGLWINDQSYGLSNSTCGQTDRAAKTGGVIKFSSSELAGTSNLQTNSALIRDVTSRPGYGGIAVFSSNVAF